MLANCFVWFTWMALSVGSMKSPIIDYRYIPPVQRWPLWSILASHSLPWSEIINVVIFHYAVMNHHFWSPSWHLGRVYRYFHAPNASDPVLGWSCSMPPVDKGKIFAGYFILGCTIIWNSERCCLVTNHNFVLSLQPWKIMIRGKYKVFQNEL
jgi:hypothetical protein